MAIVGTNRMGAPLTIIDTMAQLAQTAIFGRLL
jgi:hypothetical protein